LGATLGAMAITMSACRAGMSTDAKATDSSRDAAGKMSGKITVGGAKEAQTLRLGIKIKVLGVGDERGNKIAKAFEEQLGLFEICLASIMGTKSEVLKLTAQFTIAKSGVLTGIKVLGMSPQDSVFTDCFVKQSQQIDLGPQAKTLKGELTVGTFYGSSERPEWGLEGKHVQE